MSKLQGQLSRMQRNIEGEVAFSDIIGNSKVIQKTKELALKAGQSNIPILIKGDSGVGKELFARAVHGASARNGKPFVAVNCGAIPENLVESVLFGHERGAFTGAVEKTKGKFREAEGGTLFLDEIGELRADIQVKILRAIQEREVEPVGSSKTVKVNVRLVSATNRNLTEEVSIGNFREDLYYRINVFPFTIPPLRDRQEDIIDLLDHFTTQINTQESKQITGLTNDLKNLLSQYAWPGNVRQLENAVYRAVVMCDENILDIEDFAHIISAIYESNEELINDDILESLNKNQRGYFKGLIQHTQLNLLDADNEFKRIHVLEAEIIKSALDFYEWRISKVARKLGIGRSTLYRKMHEYDLKEIIPEPEDSELVPANGD
jgi:DNA-binding NtrC family response regulator